MFCGVVFLLPFFLFSAITEVAAKPTTCCEWLASLLRTLLGHSDKHLSFREVCASLHHLNLSGVEFTCLAVLSIIIGTLVYHLEKNLWSYGLQVFFCSRLCVRICFLIIAAFVTTVIFCCHSNANNVLVVIALTIGVLALMVSLFCVYCGEVKTTDDIWLAEAGKKRLDKNATLDRRSAQIIMGKVSTWSDFIHCGQSCAWAWIIGSTLAYFLLHRHAALVIPYWSGIKAAVCLLIAEAFIDWHRWQHVMKVLGISSRNSCYLCIRTALICRKCSHHASRKCPLLRFSYMKKN